MIENQLSSTATLNKKENVAKKAHKMPSLDQFMDLVKSEKSALASTPSGYNVYNKYSKTS